MNPKQAEPTQQTEESLRIHNLYRVIYMMLSCLWLLFMYQLSSQPTGVLSFRFIDLFSYQSAYLFIYGVLSALVFLSLHQYGRKWIVEYTVVLGFVCFIAILDEWNQFHAGFHRGAFTDVLFDLAGAMAALLILFMVKFRKKGLLKKWKI
ncbi:MAG TPA: VanZ family protein [Bacilli bacterium]